MTDENNIARINTYSALSGCYFPPDENLGSYLDQLVTGLDSWVPEAREAVQSMKSELQTPENGLEDLNVDYSRLFLGPFGVLAPPFGSVYLNPAKKMVMDETTAQVEEIYLKAGLDVDADFNNPADHITVELEFMHYLHHQENTFLGENNNIKAEEFRELRSVFFRNHLGKWGQAFADKVIKNARTDFYRHLGSVTWLVLSAETRQQAG